MEILVRVWTWWIRANIFACFWILIYNSPRSVWKLHNLGQYPFWCSLENLHTKVGALREQGITAYMWSGCYRVPSPTLTGSLVRDMQLIDEVVGAGEIAISDHRSSWPSTQVQNTSAFTTYSIMKYAWPTGLAMCCKLFIMFHNWCEEESLWCGIFLVAMKRMFTTSVELVLTFF